MTTSTSTTSCFGISVMAQWYLQLSRARHVNIA
jgi:hypothetical protein